MCVSKNQAVSLVTAVLCHCEQITATTLMTLRLQLCDTNGNKCVTLTVINVRH